MNQQQAPEIWQEEPPAGALPWEHDNDGGTEVMEPEIKRRGRPSNKNKPAPTPVKKLKAAPAPTPATAPYVEPAPPPDTIIQPVALNIPDKITSTEQLRAILEQDPPAEWLKIHPEAKGPLQADGSHLPYYYLPLFRMRQLMQMIFGGYRREIKQMTALKNSIVVTIRLTYWDPVTQAEEYQDGIGASGGAAGSMVHMAAPGAAAMAFMDAARNIGRIFGRDLNKDHGEPAEANAPLNA